MAVAQQRRKKQEASTTPVTTTGSGTQDAASAAVQAALTPTASDKSASTESESGDVATLSGQTPGPVQTESTDQSVVAAADTGQELDAGGGGDSGGGFMDWLQGMFDWGGGGVDSDFSSSFVAEEPKATYGHTTTVDSSYEEAGHLERGASRTTEIEGGSTTAEGKSTLDVSSKGDKDKQQHAGTIGTSSSTSTTVTDDEGTHTDKRSVTGSLSGTMDREGGVTTGSSQSAEIGVAGSHSDTVVLDDGSTVTRTRSSHGGVGGTRTTDKEGKADFPSEAEYGVGFEEARTTQLEEGLTRTVSHSTGLETEIDADHDEDKDAESAVSHTSVSLGHKEMIKDTRQEGRTLLTINEGSTTATGGLGWKKGEEGLSTDLSTKGSQKWTRQDERMEGNKGHTDILSASVNASHERKGDTKTTSSGGTIGWGDRDIVVDEDGRKVSDTSGHELGAQATTTQTKTDDGEKRDRGVSGSYTYSDGQIVEYTDEAGNKHRDTEDDVLKLEGGYDTGKGATAGVSFTEKSGTRTKTEDGRTISSSEEASTSLGYDKDGVGAKRSYKVVGEKEVEKLGKNTTRTTTKNQAEASAGTKVGKDADGNWVASADASASATMYEDGIKHKFGEGNTGSAEASYKALSAEAKADAKATFTQDAIKVGGNASAKATLIGGDAKIEAPVFGWKMLGEKVDVAITAGVSAAVLAEANGNIEMDISKGDDLGVQMKGGGKAFAGAKAGVEVGAKLRWHRQPDYTDLVIGFAKSLPGGVDDWLVDRIPRDVWVQVSKILVGQGVDDLVGAKAGVEGSAGVGGEANFGLEFKDGKINVSGALSGTVGLGAGVKTDIMLDAIDGPRFAGVLAMRGTEWLKDMIAEASDWYDEAVDVIQLKIDEYMEAEKAQGGISGALATAADWLGDDVFGLW